MQILFHIIHFKMTAPPLIPVVLNLLVIILIVGIPVDAQEGISSAEIQTDIANSQQYERDDELPANRVLPVDAEHKSKISFPQQSLDPICMSSLRENLIKFLKRVKRNGVRQARQDDGDDGDDGDEGGGGLLAGLGEGNGAAGALAAFAQLPSILPSFVSTLTQLSGAVNQGLNGTDTPNLPSFLVKQGQQLIQALTNSQSSSPPQPRPPPVHVQRIPGSAPGGAVPPRKPRPPGYDPEDYIDEDVKQPLQPTLPPFNQAVGFQRPSAYDPYPGNPFLENADIRPPVAQTEEPYVETINGLPPKTSLWQIYKSFRNKPQNGSLSEFQLAHPSAFSNELLQSISNSISNIRGQGPTLAAATDKPASDILKQFHPPGQPLQSSSSLFINHERPSLSVYKPATSISGVGVDLSHLALNAPKNTIVSQTPPPTSGEVPDEQSSVHAEQDFESVASLGVPQNKPGGSGGVDGPKARPTYNIKNNLATTGSLAQLQAQQGSNIKNEAHFVKSPTSAHLALAQGSYIPAIDSLHGDLAQNVGPQTNEVDTFNGVVNKTPYRPVGNGVLLQAPRLTPSPIFDLKPPSNLYINNNNRPTETIPTPEYSFSNVEPSSGSSLFPAQSLRPKDPNAPRAPTVNAVISSKLPQFSPHQHQNPHQNNAILPPSLIPQNSNSQLPQSGPIRNSPIQSIPVSQEDIKPNEPEGDIGPPTKNKNNVIASSLFNIAEAWPNQGSNVQQASNPNYASSGDSPNAPGSSNQGSHPTTESSLLQNSKLLLYLLTNFPQLLEQPNSNQAVVPSDIPNEIMDSFASSIAETTPIPPTETVAPQVQKEIVSSAVAPTLAPPSHSVNSGSPFVVPEFSPISNQAPRQSTPSPTKRPQTPPPNIQTGPINSDVFSSNWANNLLLAPAGISGSTSSSNKQQQQNPQNYFQNSQLPFGNLLQGPSSSSDVFEISTAKTDAEIETEAEPTTTARSHSSIHTIGNLLAPFHFPSGSSEANPVDIPIGNNNLNNNNKFSQTVQNAFGSPFDVPIQEPIPVSTPSSILSSPGNAGESIVSSGDSGFPSSLSDLYGNSPSGQKVQPKLEQTSPVPVITSTSRASPTPAAQQENHSPFDYQHLNFFPDSVPDAPSSGGFVPPLPPPLSKTKPVQIAKQPSFQGPAALGGYSPDVPNTPLAGPSSENQVPPFGIYVPAPVEPSNGPVFNQVDSSNQNNDPNQLPQDNPFSQKLSNMGSSAIMEMSKLPFFQHDSFRPSSLLLAPYVIGNSGGKEENSVEQMEPETEKPISELFSTVLKANVSNPNEIVTSTERGEPIPSVTPEEDSIEQEIPNFPPGKPAFWMNMYYPNGIPVLTKVRPTTEATTMKPRRRRRSTTIAPPTTTTPVPVTESEYYEDDDPTKPKRRKSHQSEADVDFVTFTT